MSFGRHFAVCAHMLDRYHLRTDRVVRPVRSAAAQATGTLAEQFPHCGKVRGALLGLTTLKITLVRAHVGNTTSQFKSEHCTCLELFTALCDADVNIVHLCRDR